MNESFELYVNAIFGLDFFPIKIEYLVTTPLLKLKSLHKKLYGTCKNRGKETSISLKQLSPNGCYYK